MDMTTLAKAWPIHDEVDDQWMEVTPGERVRICISVEETDGIYSMIEIVADPRNGVPMHIHSNEDEHFVVLEGTLHVANGNETLDVPAGGSVTVSKGVPHAWCNLSDSPVRMLIIFSPGSIERLFRAVATRESDDMEAIAALANKFGTQFVGPALVDGIYTIASPRG
jgi:mannose-6-phosphate isomerase-like protein (cupin superfamily)